MNDIFIQIAAYRDSDLPATLRNLIERAADPERLHFGIFLQLKPEDPAEWADLPEHPHMKVERIDAAASQGCCWARSQAQKFYNNETYWLQIDSHMRAVYGWDRLLVQMHAATGDSKAVLSTFPNGFEQPNHLLGNNLLPMIGPKGFSYYDLLMFEAALVRDTFDQPIPSACVAGGFIFGPGEVVVKVPYDPELYFYGEEISLALRLFTHGFNMYNPHKNVLYHLYKEGEGKEPTHWGDHNDWFKLNRKSMVRVHALCGTLSQAPKACEPNVLDLKDIDRYWLGSKRSLSDYEKVCGVSFKSQRINSKG